MNKYHNKKIVVDGLVFDSKLEANRWSELSLLVKAGEIEELERQKRFTLQEPFITGDGERIRAITYIADFVYKDKRTGRLIAEDAKGVKTDVYRLKKKLFLKAYPYWELREVYK